MNTNSKIYVAGHTGFVGRHLLNKLHNYKNVITASKQTLNLLSAKSVDDFFYTYRPEYVFICAAKVGSLSDYNTWSYEFLNVNLRIQINLIETVIKYGVKRCLLLSSAAVFPNISTTSINEGCLLSGKLERNVESYALSKIVAAKLCEYSNRKIHRFTVIFSSNLYGPGSARGNLVYDIIDRISNAKIKNIKNVSIWGTGNATRDLLYVEDLATIMMSIINSNKYKYDYINVGSGVGVSINTLNRMVAMLLGVDCKFEHDLSKPEGVMSRTLDISRLRSIWSSGFTDLSTGLNQTIKWYKENKINV